MLFDDLTKILFFLSYWFLQRILILFSSSVKSVVCVWVMPFFSIPADTCYNYSEHYCESPKYWYQGFLSLQSSIDAAIIEVNNSYEPQYISF